MPNFSTLCFSEQKIPSRSGHSAVTPPTPTISVEYRSTLHPARQWLAVGLLKFSLQAVSMELDIDASPAQVTTRRVRVLLPPHSSAGEGGGGVHHKITLHAP